MRVSEMRQREDYDSILCASLERSLSVLHSGRYVVTSVAAPGAQLWRFDPMFSAYFSDEVGAIARRFLADSFRYTRVLWRAVPQFLLGTTLATSWALRRARPSLWISPPLPNPEHTLIVPGNRRIRIFDFSTRTVRVSAKVRFDSACMINEITVRSKSSGPFPRITRAGPDHTWFDEPIISGWTLARCPPWVSSRNTIEVAFRALDEFCETGRASVSAVAYADERRDALYAHIDAAESKFGPSTTLTELRQFTNSAASLARSGGRFTVGPTHGDMQAGNVLLTREGGVLVTDWEHYGSRLADYDHMVFEIGSRSGNGLGQRLKSYARRFERNQLAHIGAFLLEDLTWFLRESLAGPFLRLPASVTGYAEELGRLGPGFDELIH